MKRRENMDYRKLSALLGAWDDTSLSAEEEKELEGCVSDSDYGIMEADADAFISSLAAKEKNARRRPLWGVWLSAAAACAAVIAVATWLFISDAGTDKRTEMIAVKTEQSTEIQDNAEIKTPAVEQPEAAVPKAYSHKSAPVLKATPEDNTPDYKDDAWDQFFAMREEMADVVRPGQIQDGQNEITVVVSSDVLDDGKNVSIDVYGSLKDASEILNSILCEL